MTIRHALLAATLVATFSIPAFAATEYWVAKSEATKKCEVVTKKPDGKKLMEVGMQNYQTKQSAEKAMKVAAECK
jgi:hypothetical protein